MEIIGRVLTTLFIWGGMAGMMSIISRQLEGGNLSIVVIFGMIAATVATGVVWQHTRSNTRPEITFGATEKNKRSSRNRLNQLISTMSEDEAAEMLSDMRARILTEDGSDGELPIEALLGEREYRNRNRQN
jgi:hypothetical protein